MIARIIITCGAYRCSVGALSVQSLGTICRFVPEIACSKDKPTLKPHFVLENACFKDKLTLQLHFVLENACFKDKPTLKLHFVLENACFKDKPTLKLHFVLEIACFKDKHDSIELTASWHFDSIPAGDENIWCKILQR